MRKGKGKEKNKENASPKEKNSQVFGIWSIAVVQNVTRFNEAFP